MTRVGGNKKRCERYRVGQHRYKNKLRKIKKLYGDKPEVLEKAKEKVKEHRAARRRR